MARFAANISFLFTELPFVERIAAAAKAGFGAVECHYPYDTPPATLHAALHAAGIPMLGINTRNGTARQRDAGVAAVPGRTAETMLRLRQAIDYAHAIGARAVHVTAGNADPADEAAQAALLDALRRASDLAAGLTILVEPLNRRENPAYFLRSTAQALAMVQRAGRDDVRLMYDVYHAASNGEDVLAALPGLLPWIAHVQMAAVPSRAEPNEEGLDCQDVCATLDRLGYQGWVGAEYHPSGATLDGLCWLRQFAATG